MLNTCQPPQPIILARVGPGDLPMDTLFQVVPLSYQASS